MSKKLEKEMKATTKTTGKEPKVKKEKGPTIAALCRKNIMEGMTWEQSKAAIDKAFPGNDHSKACYYWYRTKMKSEGAKVPDLIREKKEKTPKAAKRSRGKVITNTAEGVAEAEKEAVPA